MYDNYCVEHPEERKEEKIRIREQNKLEKELENKNKKKELERKKKLKIKEKKAKQMQKWIKKQENKETIENEVMITKTEYRHQ